MSLPEFHHQSTSGPDANLCAFFATRHFLGDCDKEDFLVRAAEFYKQEVPGIDDETAKNMAADGNDPAVVSHYLSKSGAESFPDNGYEGKTRIIIALLNKAHFICLCRDTDNSPWNNYDSLQGQPTVINNIQQFLNGNPGRHYWTD